MTRNQDLLDWEVGTPPPSVIDVDRVIARQRHRVRFSRAALVGSTGAMAVAFALVLGNLPHAADSNDANTPASAAQPAAAPRVVLPSPPTAEEFAARFTAALADLPSGLHVPSDGSVEFVYQSNQDQYFAAWGVLKKGSDGYPAVGKDLRVTVNITSEPAVQTWDGCGGAPKANNCTFSSDEDSATYFMINTQEKVNWASVDFLRLEGTHMVRVSISASTTAKLPSDIKALLVTAAQNPGFTFEP